MLNPNLFDATKPKHAVTKRTCIVIVEIEGAEGRQTVGLQSTLSTKCSICRGRHELRPALARTSAPTSSGGWDAEG